jgi:parallel beta-helix repeat protein
MSKRIAYALLVSLILVSLVHVQFVEAQSSNNTIYIRPDGTIEPSTAPIQLAGNTYTFTDDIFNSTIVIQCSDIVIDGANYLLQGEPNTGIGYFVTPVGLNLTNLSNVIVKNLEFRDFGKGIYLENAQNCIITNNTLKTTNGIFLNQSSYNQISNNTLTPNIDLTYTQNIAVWAFASSFNNVTGNQISGYWWQGIRIGGSNSIIDSNSVTECGRGIVVAGPSNIISANEVFSTVLAHSFHIDANAGIGLEVGGDENQVVKNLILNNGVGIYLTASGSTIYLNTFVNNTNQVELFNELVNATWDNGKEGNYWSDYQSRYPNASEVDSSGIWDTPYIIAENNVVDNYPLQNMSVSIPEPTTSSEPFSLTTIITLIVVVVVLSIFLAGFFVYLRKRKKYVSACNGFSTERS